jgi:hypothetical protein
MKLILQDGEVSVDIGVLLENFKFFEMFEEMGVKNDDLFDMTELPLTKEIFTSLISLSTTGELDIISITDKSFLRSLIHANMYLDAKGKIYNLIENGHVYNRVSLYESCPELYEVTVKETYIRKRIAQGDVKPFTSLIEITDDVCKSVHYQEFNKDCPLLLRDLSIAYYKEHYKKKYKTDDDVLTLREPTCERIKEILSLGNVVIAGGYILELLANAKTKASDVDIFIWGVSEEEADKKLQKISEIVCGDPYFTGNSYTFAYRYDKNDHNVAEKWTSQVILRLYQSPDEILHGFDIQACKVLLCMENGAYKYYGTQSFLDSMRYNAVWIDTERQSSSYAMRLLKYYCKGFDVLMTGYNKKLVSKEILEGNIVDKKGLALLLRYEHEIIKNNPEGLWMSKRSDFDSLLNTIRRILKKQKLTDSDYEERISIFKTGKDMFNFLRRGWHMYFSNYNIIMKRMGWRWVSRRTTQLPKATWNKRDPSSQTIIGSFHPEQEQYYNQAFGITSFSVFVMDKCI